MKLPVYIPARGRCFRGGFTLIELLAAFAIGLVVVGAVCALSIVGAEHFLATSNYVNMDNQSRNAVDKISREIRNATALLSFSTNNPQVLVLTNGTAGTSSTITCDTSTGILTLAKTGQTTQTLLTGCDSFSFQIFNRYPLITATNMSFYSCTNFLTGAVDPKFCKVIDLNWRCSRSILGSKLNTEIVQTAQVVLRNQVTN